jgi:hypothetical protein
MYIQKVKSRKNLFFAGILKVSDENSRIRIQDPDPDPLVRGTDPRIRIHPKMSWIRNTDFRLYLGRITNFLYVIPEIFTTQKMDRTLETFLFLILGLPIEYFFHLVVLRFSLFFYYRKCK